MGNVVGAWDVDHQEDNIIDVDIVQAMGVDRNVDNQLHYCSEKNVVVEKDSWRHQQLIWRNQIKRIPIVLEKGGICQVTYCLGEDTPHIRTGLAAKTQTQSLKEDSEFGEHGAGLRCSHCVEMHLLENGLVINLRCQYWEVGVESTSSDGPIEDPPDA